ncbi:MAG: polymer-forming cytoskeletal protein [Oscillospiraceae bacterium]|nr:polymer-forming cytoskeletal protein [Oscillospiraceae bacterium]
MTRRQLTSRRAMPAVIGERVIDLKALIIEDENENAEEKAYENEPASYNGRETDTTVLASGTTFCGDIKTDGHIEIAGTLLGSAEAQKNIIISGKIEGNASGYCISLQSCAVRGNITAKGELTVEEGSVVSGDVSAASIALGGKVCGNIKSTGALVLQTGAYVVGDIEADTITMQEGCALFGNVNVLSKESEKLTKEEFDSLIDERK